MLNELFLDRAVGWVGDRLNYFSTQRARTQPMRMMTIKRIGELALAGALLARRRPEGEHWLDAGWELLDRGEVLRADLPHTPMLAVIYSVFARANRRSQEIETVLRDEAWRTLAKAIPRDFRLFLNLTLESIDVPPVEPWAQYLAAHPIARQPAATSLTDADAYSISSAAGWLTDFGRARDARLDEEEVEYLHEVVPPLLETARALGNTELLAASLLTANCVGLVVSEETWQRLAMSQAASGVVVRGLTADPDAWVRGKGEGEIFVQHVSATFAAIIASTTRADRV